MIIWIFLLSSCLWARDLSTLTLNLHGLHPTGEERRQKLLASQLSDLRADLIFLQEVGGGEMSQTKTCADFQRTNTGQGFLGSRHLHSLA